MEPPATDNPALPVLLLTGGSGYVEKYRSNGAVIVTTASVTVADNDPFIAANDAYSVD